MSVQATPITSLPAYCSIAQLGSFVDTRTLTQLSGDDNSVTANNANLQTLLDAAASELDSHLAGRIAMPLASVPPMLTRWVAIKTIDRLYGRRVDRPKSLAADLQWCDDWIADFEAGRISLPGVSRQVATASNQCIDMGIDHARRRLTDEL